MSTNQSQESRKSSSAWFQIPEGCKDCTPFTIPVSSSVVRSEKIDIGTRVTHNDRIYEVVSVNAFNIAQNQAKGRFITLVTMVHVASQVDLKSTKDESKPSHLRAFLHESHRKVKRMLKSKTTRFLIAGGVILACTLFGALTAERD